MNMKELSRGSNRRSISSLLSPSSSYSSNQSPFTSYSHMPPFPSTNIPRFPPYNSFSFVPLTQPLTPPKPLHHHSLLHFENSLSFETVTRPLSPPPFPTSLLQLSISMSKPKYTLQGFEHSHNTIHQYKENLIKYSKEVRKLKSSIIRLKALAKCLGEEDWAREWSKMEQQKVAVASCKEALKCYSHEDLLTQLLKRMRKRIRLKKKMIARQKIKKIDQSKNNIENSLINMWLDKTRVQMEKAQRDRKVREAADNVLFEVRRKKTDARAMLSLLSKMQKLRNLRIQNRKSKSEFVSQEAAEAFDALINALKSKWINQLREYSTEEVGLKVMLQDTKPNTTVKNGRQNWYKEWLQVIFGESHFDNQLDWNYTRKLREHWDAYVVGSEENGSCIPAGCVLPVTPSSCDWSRFIVDRLS